MRRYLFVTFSFIIAMGVAGLLSMSTASAAKPGEQQQKASKQEAAAGLGQVESGVAVMNPVGKSKLKGKIQLNQKENILQLKGSLSGLEPNRPYFVFAHQYGNCGGDQAKMTGGAYKAGAMSRGASEAEQKQGEQAGLSKEEMQKWQQEWKMLRDQYPGLLGYFQTDGKGKARFEQAVTGYTLTGEANPLLGRSLVIAPAPKGGRGSGEAEGKPMGCGVIGISK